MGKLFPYLYDLGMKPLEKKTFKRIRGQLLQRAYGRVLEIGSGSGINFPLYKDVEQVDAIEPSSDMEKKSEERKAMANVPIYHHQESAEKLSFPDNTFDCVVSTLVFCTIPSPEKAMNEIMRVSKPGATLLFFEHVKMDQPFLAQTQVILTPVWKKICDGCHLDRDTLKLIKKSGIQIKEVEHYYKGLFISVIGKNR